MSERESVKRQSRVDLRQPGMASDGLILPSPEELEIQDINISTPLFKVLAPQVGMACDEVCKVSPAAYPLLARS